MNKNFRLLSSVICLSILLGLAPGSVYAGRALLLSGNFNPKYSDLRLKKIVVAAPNVVQSFRDQIEIRLIDELKDVSDGGVKGIRFADVIPPFQQYTEKEVLAKLTSQQIEAVVIIDIQLAGGRREEEENRKLARIARDMGGALVFSANYRPEPSYRGKYRATAVTVFHLASGGVIWRGTGQVNATKDSVKWQKRSGRMLAKKLSAALKASSILFINKPEPVIKENEPNVNFTTGDDPEE